MSEIKETSQVTETKSDIPIPIIFTPGKLRVFTNGLNDIIKLEISKGTRSLEVKEGERPDSVERFRASCMEEVTLHPNNDVGIFMSVKEAQEISEHFKELKQSGKIEQKQIEEYDKVIAYIINSFMKAEEKKPPFISKRLFDWLNGRAKEGKFD